MMTNQMSAESMEMMRKAIDEVLYLSDEQENLYNEIQPLGARSQLLPQFAEKQQDLKSEAERLRALDVPTGVALNSVMSWELESKDIHAAKSSRAFRRSGP